MKLDLSDVVANLGKKLSYEIDEPPLEDLESGLKGVGPLKGKVTFTNSGRHIVVRGEFTTVIELECARCLRSYRYTVELPIEEEFALPGHTYACAEEQEEVEFGEDEAEPLFVENIFDLTELLRQQILVTMPIKPLCSVECKGICPTCGKDLAEGPCECLTEEINPALAKLSALVEERKEDD
jgi:uncharacterized protein